MANEFIIKNGFHSKGDSQLTGSLTVSGVISGSVFSGSFVGDGSGLTDTSGKSYFVTEQTVYPYQILGDVIGYGLTPTIAETTINAAPMSFGQDVVLKKVSVENVVAPLFANTGSIGVYELISKSIQSSVEYYQFDLVHTVSTTFNFNVAGAQEITLSTPYTMSAGKVYVVALLVKNASSYYNSKVTQIYAMEYNRFLGKFNRTLITTTTQAYNPFTNNLPTSMPSSLYMYPNTDAYTSREPIMINIQNA